MCLIEKGRENKGESGAEVNKSIKKWRRRKNKLNKKKKKT